MQLLPNTIEHATCPTCSKEGVLIVETTLTMTEDPGGDHAIVFLLSPKITCLSCKTVIYPVANDAGGPGATYES